ncbi:hypothetical protein J7J90_00620 [Candidatus Micrarchaeota archaeon]|nr:hypothetical protein [Candidatus Micrarchaeota archaeon]
MDINIINKFENKLLDREEYELSIDFEGATPKRIQIRDKFSALVNSKPNLTIVKKVFNRAGMHNVLCRVHVYKSEEALKRNEPKYIIDRHAKKEVTEGKKEEDKPSSEQTKTEPKPDEKTDSDKKE